MALTLIVSQTEGVLPSLTEFHHIKENGRYGLEGSLQNYALALYPDAKLSRTTVRGKIDSDPLLREALNITSEMCQIGYMWHSFGNEYYITPKDMYEKLTAKGYDWKVLLNTRGWWTYDNDKQEVPFLSTMDLIRMTFNDDHPDAYKPYWLNK
jgi:hypothetical protein